MSRSCSNLGDVILSRFLAFFLTVLTLAGCARGPAGLEFGKPYEAWHGTTGGNPIGNVRYIFSGSTANFQAQLQNGNNFAAWVVRLNGELRLVYCHVETGDLVNPVGLGLGTLNIEYKKNIPPDISPTTNSYGAERYKRSDLDAIAIHKPGDWVTILENAPVNIRENSLIVDWSSNSPLAKDFGCDSGSEVLDVESGGTILRNAEVREITYKLATQ